MNSEDKKAVVYIGIPVLVSFVYKLVLIWIDRIPFNSDEAIVALMARHILQGEFPVFFYGQSYMGSLDAFLAALGFYIFGEEVWVIRFIQSILYLGTVLITVMLARQLFSSYKVGLYAGILAAIPVVNVTLYTTVSLGGYGEALLIGNSLLLLALLIGWRKSRAAISDPGFSGLLILWGGLAGIGFWVMGLTLIYAVPGAVLIFWQLAEKKNSKQMIVSLMIISLAFAAGSSPWWITAINSGGGEFVSEMFGSAVSVSRFPKMLAPVQRFSNFLLLGGTVILGMRPPWNVAWLMLPLIPGILVFWFSVAYKVHNLLKKEIHRRQIYLLLLGPILILVLTYVFTPFGSDPSGRYFVPFVVPLSIFAGYFISKLDFSRAAWKPVLLGVVIIFNLGGTIQCLNQYPPGLTTQFDQASQIDHRPIGELIDFLTDNDLAAGYTNYWVAYPLAFHSGEGLVYLPKLPYHPDFRYTERDNRYTPYNHVVEKSNSLSYIIPDFPELEDYLEDSLRSRDISWKERRIGEYLVIYDLSQTVRPKDIGLGKTTNP